MNQGSSTIAVYSIIFVTLHHFCCFCATIMAKYDRLQLLTLPILLHCNIKLCTIQCIEDIEIYSQSQGTYSIICLCTQMWKNSQKRTMILSLCIVKRSARLCSFQLGHQKKIPFKFVDFMNCCWWSSWHCSGGLAVLDFIRFVFWSGEEFWKESKTRHYSYSFFHTILAKMVHYSRLQLCIELLPLLLHSYCQLLCLVWLPKHSTDAVAQWSLVQNLLWSVLLLRRWLPELVQKNTSHPCIIGDVWRKSSSLW